MHRTRRIENKGTLAVTKSMDNLITGVKTACGLFVRSEQ